MKKKIFNISFIFLVILFIVFVNYKTNNVNTKTVTYNGDDLRISIDGETSTTLPTSGNYYLVDYDCKDSITKITWDRINYKLNVSNGTKKGGVVCYLKFKSEPLLGEMPVGSYVKYEGSNGCVGDSCMGQNANYVDDSDMGYCNSDAKKFYVNGWRIGYINNGSAHLISAGSTDCVCTNSNGDIVNDTCGTSSLSSTNFDKHIKNLNDISLKYCNPDYSNGSVCNNDTAWAMSADDFKKITKSELTSIACFVKYSDKKCGYTNDLIDNGSYYWYANYHNTLLFSWSPMVRLVEGAQSSKLYGVRPVLALSPIISVTGGSGTYDDPYLISSNNFIINGGNEYISASDNLSSVQLTLNAVSEVTSMCVSVNTETCENYVNYSNTYTLDFSSVADGEVVVYVYYKNTVGDIVATMHESIIKDVVAPTNNSILISGGNSVDRTLKLSSTGASYMCFSNTSNNPNNCNDWVNYTTNYAWTLEDGVGDKTVYAFFKDQAGNISSPVSDTVTITNISNGGVEEYEFWLDAYNPGYIYLMRSDGATALVSVDDTSVEWYNSSGSDIGVDICAAENTSTNGSIWCVDDDLDRAYYKSFVDSQWTSFDVSSLLGDLVSGDDYSISVADDNSLYFLNHNGTRAVLTSTGTLSGLWNYGTVSAVKLAACSTANGLSLGGSASSQTVDYVTCIGEERKFYYSNSMTSNNALEKLDIGIKNADYTFFVDAFAGTSNSNISIKNVPYINIIAIDNLNSAFMYSSFDLPSILKGIKPSWSEYTLIGYNEPSECVGGMCSPGEFIFVDPVTCTSTTYSSSDVYSICLYSDNYLYFNNEQSSLNITK